jgi:HEAT repeat protein
MRIILALIVLLVSTDTPVTAQPVPEAKPAPKDAPPKTAPADPAQILIKALTGRDQATRQAAARQLGVMGAKAIPALVQAAKQKVSSQSLASAFAEMSPKTIPALADVIRNDKDERVRRAVAQGLGLMGPAAVSAIVTLAADEDKYLRLSAFEALDHMSTDSRIPVPGKAVAVLVAGLKDEELIIREFSAGSLGRIGPKTDAVVPALLVALAEDIDGRVRTRGAAALERIARYGGANEKFSLALAKSLAEDKESTVRTAAAAALGALRKDAAAGVKALAAALADKHGPVREAAAHALYEIGPPAAAAITQLQQVIAEDDWPKARWYATGALGRLGSAATPAVVTLGKALSDENRDVQAAAAQSLSRLGATALPALESLIGALQNDQGVVREHAATSLGNFGTKAASSTEALTALLEDKSPRVRNAAKFALSRIQPKKPAN